MQPLNFNVERLLTRLTVGRSWPKAQVGRRAQSQSPVSLDCVSPS